MKVSDITIISREPFGDDKETITVSRNGEETVFYGAPYFEDETDLYVWVAERLDDMESEL